MEEIVNIIMTSETFITCHFEFYMHYFRFDFLSFVNMQLANVVLISSHSLVTEGSISISTISDYQRNINRLTLSTNKKRMKLATYSLI